MTSQSGSATNLLARHSGLVRAFFQRRVACPEEAEDLSQEALCAILTSASRFRGDASESTWVWAICRHVLADGVRRQVRERRLTEILRQAAAPPARAEPEVDSLALRTGLDRLSPALRELYRQRFILGRSIKEIASRQDLPEGTVKYHLSELRRRIRELLG